MDPIITRSLSPASLAVALLLGLALAATTGGATAAAQELPPGGTYTDDDGIVHEGHIEALTAEDITTGCREDRFCPDREVTRGQMAAFLRSAFDLPASDTDHFSDDDGDLFEDDINAVADAGITTGCEEDEFCPGDDVDRRQMARLLATAGELPASDEDAFTDDDGDMFEDDINAIAAAGVTTGCEDGRFCPDLLTERGEMASFLGRLLDLEPTTPPEPEPEPEPEPAEAEAESQPAASPKDPADQSPREAIRTWFPNRYNGALNVAKCESNLNPHAVNPSGYHGLFQIGSRYHSSAFERVTGQSWDSGRYVAYYNAQYAKHLFDQSGTWRAWTCKP